MYREYVNYKDMNAVERVTNMIIEAFECRDKEFDEIVIVNIGTDRCIGDAVGPVTGTFLEEHDNKNYTVYGTIKYPVHALNIEKKLKQIKEKHNNALIIAIDACMGDRDDINDIVVRDYSIKPGSGVGKTLSKVGDMSIIFVSDTHDNSELFSSSNNIRLDTIFDASKIIAQAVNKACAHIIKQKTKNSLIEMFI